MRYWFPHPFLSLMLTMLWLLLNRSASLGHILLGAVLGISLAWAMVNLEPARSKLRRITPVLRLAGNLFEDLLRSNIAVAAIALRRRPKTLRSGFVTLTLALEDDNAVAMLALLLSATPGSAWMEFDSRTRVLLLHMLDLDDPLSTAEAVRNRYETPLKEIFG